MQRTTGLPSFRNQIAQQWETPRLRDLVIVIYFPLIWADRWTERTAREVAMFSYWTRI